MASLLLGLSASMAGSSQLGQQVAALRTPLRALFAQHQQIGAFSSKASALVIPADAVRAIPTTIPGGQAFGDDMRGASGLGLGDGITTHTDKWLQGDQKSPMEYIQEAEPILVEGPVVASHGSEDPALGCPVEYINLKGTTKEHPAVCKYTGNRYYSLPHTWYKH